MINNVVVTYTIRPEAKEEHVRFIEAVFAQLSKEKPNNVDYQVMCLDDGVSFVHMSSADTADGSNPLPKLSAFKEFSKNISERVTSMPNPTSATVIGSYHGKI
jgi:hypothetical protein